MASNSGRYKTAAAAFAELPDPKYFNYDDFLITTAREKVRTPHIHVVAKLILNRFPSNAHLHFPACASPSVRFCVGSLSHSRKVHQFTDFRGEFNKNHMYMM